jgi:hypothetical protein
MEKRVEVLAVYMFEDGFSIEVHPLVTTDDGEFVRDRLIELLPVFAKQLKNPDSVREVKTENGISYGVLWPVHSNNENRKKAN